MWHAGFVIGAPRNEHRQSDGSLRTGRRDNLPRRADVELSGNFQLTLEGLAYPTYYKGLFSDLRAAFTAAAQQARKIWREDQTAKRICGDRLEAFTDDIVMLPKLFRRLAAFMDGGSTIAASKQFLSNRAEGMTIISQAHFTHFDTLVRVQGNTVRLT